MDNEIKLAIIRVMPFLIVICVIFFLIKKQKIKALDLDIQKPFSLKLYLLWTVGFLIYTLLTEFSLDALQLLEVNQWHHAFKPSLILIFGAMILAPIAEELIFRGLILNVLIKKNLNIHLAILIQACFFVLLHNFTYENNLSSNIGIVQSLTDAILFGYARKYTKSIYTPITMHIAGNAIALLERFIL